MDRSLVAREGLASKPPRSNSAFRGCVAGGELPDCHRLRWKGLRCTGERSSRSRFRCPSGRESRCCA
eukprot:2636175-Alexandrium_andersonii.AAC.1